MIASHWYLPMPVDCQNDLAVVKDVLSKPRVPAAHTRKDVLVRPCLTIDSYRWFEDSPGKPLPAIDKMKVAKHLRGNSLGHKHKAQRPNQRVIAVSGFRRIDSLDDLLTTLLGVNLPLTTKAIKPPRTSERPMLGAVAALQPTTASTQQGVIVLPVLIDTVSARKSFYINELCKELFVEKSLVTAQ